MLIIETNSANMNTAGTKLAIVNINVALGLVEFANAGTSVASVMLVITGNITNIITNETT
jgi:hypothetical protein